MYPYIRTQAFTHIHTYTIIALTHTLSPPPMHSRTPSHLIRHSHSLTLEQTHTHYTQVLTFPRTHPGTRKLTHICLCTHTLSHTEGGGGDACMHDSVEVVVVLLIIDNRSGRVDIIGGAGAVVI